MNLSEVPSQLCRMEKENLEQALKEEGLVRNEPATWICSTELSEHGRLILTHRRLFFARNVINNSVYSRYFFNDQSLTPLVEIDLDTINTIAREKFVVDENILSITYMQYESVRFSVIRYEDWETDIQRTRMKPDIPGDPNRENEEEAA